jgi:hypothetical protein
VRTVGLYTAAQPVLAVANKQQFARSQLRPSDLVIDLDLGMQQEAEKPNSLRVLLGPRPHVSMAKNIVAPLLPNLLRRELSMQSKRSISVTPH